MANVAVTRIKHGDEDGKTKWYEPGEEVTGISGEALKALKDGGSVVEVDRVISSREEDDATVRRDRMLMDAGKYQGNTPAAGLSQEDEQALRDRINQLEQENAELQDQLESATTPTPTPAGQ